MLKTTLMMVAYLMKSPLGDLGLAQDFTLTSPVFSNNEVIPSIYTCYGKNISVPLHWQGIPVGTKSLALIMIDRDVPRAKWYQWTLYNIMPNQVSLPANVSIQKPLSLANNSWGKKQYRGPCPTLTEHHYVFQLYALDTVLPNSVAKSTIKLRKAMREHIIAVTDLVGRVKAET